MFVVFATILVHSSAPAETQPLTGLIFSSNDMVIDNLRTLIFQTDVSVKLS